MPSQLTYPGVYVEELPSGTRTITGVSTSVTAFVGRCTKGPVNDPVLITSFAEFERIFGGLWKESKLGFAVKDFYINGGTQAIIVRLTDGAAAKATFTIAGDFILEAANPGTWGNELKAIVSINSTSPEAAIIAQNLGVTTAQLFDLTIEEASTGVVIEKHINLTIIDSIRKVDTVLANESNLVRVNTVSAIPTNGSNVIGASGDDGLALASSDFVGGSNEADKTGLYALEKADIFNLLCIPPYKTDDNIDASIIDEAVAYCTKRRAFFIIDSPVGSSGGWKDVASVKTGIAALSGAGGVGAPNENAAVFFPRLKAANPLNDNQIEEFAPCGAIAGVFARTDAERGIWKAPAGLEANILGAADLTVSLTEGQIGQLNPKGVNCLRKSPAAGLIVWGARTRKGDDAAASE